MCGYVYNGKRDRAKNARKHSTLAFNFWKIYIYPKFEENTHTMAKWNVFYVLEAGSTFNS